MAVGACRTKGLNSEFYRTLLARSSTFHVVSFVDRYIPGYVFFGEGVSKPFEMQGDVKHPPWLGNGLRLVIGEERELVAVEEF